MNNNSEPNTEVLLCECNSPEHVVVFQYWKNDNDYEEVYMAFHLRPAPLKRRIVNAVKYIFGHRSKYGEFDEVILKPADYVKMQKVADYLKECYDRKQNDKDRH